MTAINDALDAVQNILNSKDVTIPDKYGKKLHPVNERILKDADLPFSVANKLLEAGEEAARKVEEILIIEENAFNARKEELQELARLLRESAKERSDKSLQYTENMKKISDLMLS